MKMYFAKFYLIFFVVAMCLLGCSDDDVDTDVVCEIADLIVEVGECSSDSTYTIVVDFEVDNPSDDHFDLFIRNNELIGFFPLSDLPLTITDFSPSGLPDDYIRVCINDNPECCQEIEFFPPECMSDECAIFDLSLIHI